MAVAGERGRFAVAVAYCAFVLVGVSAGVGGVLLPAQMSDYGVDRAKIGITFFVFSAGFMLAGASTGALVHRLGTRVALAAGTAVFALSAFYTATRPTFAGLVVVQVALGYGIGVLEAVLNTYLAQLSGAARRVNWLHAFFGVGALVGPLLATWMLSSRSWTSVWLVIAVLLVPLLIGILLAFPLGASSGPAPGTERRGLLTDTVRDRSVQLGALFLAVYVGLEISVGNWGFSFLVDGRGQSRLLAGYAVSGFWFGLTAGRFVISPVASWIGLSELGMTFACLTGIAAVIGLIWLASGPVMDSASFALLGFFLGPVFPTTMAITPRLTEQRRVPTAIGVINGVSVIGGSVLPWLAGTITESAGVSALIPFSVTLAALLLLIWWRLARQLGLVRQTVTVG
ncbi:MAG TPA: MFS transporter [Actinocrinis sp.]|uniref:MFS transporter n=1 Tax=Actinocrinis sp. TaxID=1920516 RepID=UPI002DDCFD1C|nr:MFS transporter [Actinocrinis sp.]HEV2346127.1 MFS transporter [Actinocrinis sp.]